MHAGQRNHTTNTAAAAQATADHWLGRVTAAALAFEARWTMLALRRVDAELATRLHDQRNLWVEALVTGAAREVAEQGGAMCRGYAVATAALEAAAGGGAPDDAYWIGCCPDTGTMVAIGEQKAALGRIRELYGDEVIHLTPDEVACLFGKVAALQEIGAVKRRFPGAEIQESARTEG